MGWGQDYCICPNIGPGLYFFPGSFDPASIRAQFLFQPGFYLGPASIKIFFLILGFVSNIKSVVYSMAPRIGRMTASQDSHVTSSVVKESVVRGHHMYKVAAASLVVFSVHSTAFNLKETL